MFGIWRDWLDAARFGFETQHVIALRMMHVAPGGTRAADEVQRMVSEKAAAFFAAQAAATTALVCGQSLATATRLAAAPYRSRVRANRRRLTRSAK
jgi:hypothetical protein